MIRHLTGEGQLPDEQLPNLRAELRSKARGVLWVSWLIRQLPALHPETGCYLTFAPGPVHAPLMAALESAADRVAVLEKSLPPKDYFIANPAMKAAQISIEFQLHGPWMCFPNSLHDCYRYAELDLRTGQVPAVLVGGFYEGESECAFIQYATRPEELLACPVVNGRFGPFTAVLPA